MDTHPERTVTPKLQNTPCTSVGLVSSRVGSHLEGFSFVSSRVGSHLGRIEISTRKRPRPIRLNHQNQPDGRRFCWLWFRALGFGLSSGQEILLEIWDHEGLLGSIEPVLAQIVEGQLHGMAQPTVHAHIEITVQNLTAGAFRDTPCADILASAVMAIHHQHNPE